MFKTAARFEWNGDTWIRELNLVGNDAAMKKVLEDLEKKIELQMATSPPSGNYYYRYKNGMKWQGFSSKPGFAPKINFGDLVKSIGYEKIAQSRYNFFVDAPYAAFLEFGTATILPRPFFVKNVRVAYNKYIESVKEKFRTKKISKTSSKTYGEKYGF